MPALEASVHPRASGTTPNGPAEVRVGHDGTPVGSPDQRREDAPGERLILIPDCSGRDSEKIRRRLGVSPGPVPS